MGLITAEDFLADKMDFTTSPVLIGFHPLKQ